MKLHLILSAALASVQQQLTRPIQMFPDSCLSQ